MAANKEEAIGDEVLDQLLTGRDPATVFESGGLIDELKKRLAERMLNAEMDHHLGDGAQAGNHRNGYGSKTVLTDTSKLELLIPRDRHGRFDPVLIGKYRRRFAGFDDKIIALYARGMTTREIAAHVGELYGLEISPDLVSAVTDAVLEEVAGWQNRGLEATYAIVFFDAIRVKIRNEGMVNNRAVYLAIGVRCSGHKEILGLWIEQTEGAKFWLRVMTEIRNRGTQDILIAVVDGLKGFPEAMHCPSAALLDAFCIVARAPIDRCCAAPDLPGRIGRGGARAARGFRARPVGTKISRHRAKLAAQLGAGDSAVRLRSGAAQNNLHHQRHREPQCPGTQSGQSPRPLPQRRGGHQAYLAGAA